MITKLKEAAGFEYTNKLQRMFTGSFFPTASPSEDLLLTFRPSFRRHELEQGSQRCFQREDAADSRREGSRWFVLFLSFLLF